MGFSARSANAKTRKFAKLSRSRTFKKTQFSRPPARATRSIPTRTRAARIKPPPATKGHHEAWTTEGRVKAFLALCHDPLQDLQSWMDEGKRGGRTGNLLSARPRASMAGNDGLRPFRRAASRPLDAFRLAVVITRPVRTPLIRFRRAGAVMVRPTSRKAPVARRATSRPIIPHVALNNSRAEAAYFRAAAAFDTQIAAVMSDTSLTPEQRRAKVAMIRLQQRQAANAARQWVIDDERAAAKARRRLLRRQAHRRPKR